MISEKTLREAVRLAAGWSVTTDGYYNGPDVLGASLSRINKSALAALASQLTLQVDALFEPDDYMVYEYPESSEVVINNAVGNDFVSKAEGPNRDHNTINCIVESALLDKGDNL